jgi:hypothetical protein
VYYDAGLRRYFMFYTCYGVIPNQGGNSILLCLATSTNPTQPNGWVRYGPVFPHVQVVSGWAGRACVRAGVGRLTKRSPWMTEQQERGRVASRPSRSLLPDLGRWPHPHRQHHVRASMLLLPKLRFF